MTDRQSSACDAPMDLAALLERVAGVLPMLRGHTVNAVDTAPDAAIALLHATIAKTYPEAGKVYWSARTWQVWSWQSVYVNVIATQLYGAAVDVSHLVPCIKDDFVDGFTIAGHVVVAGNRDAAVAAAQAACRNWVARYAPVVSQYGSFSEKVARQYMVDSMLGALMYLQSKSLLSNVAALQEAKVWADSMALVKPSTLSCVPLPQPHLLLHNALCCQHYRRDKDALCPGCPRHYTHRQKSAQNGDEPANML